MRLSEPECVFRPEYTSSVFDDDGNEIGWRMSPDNDVFICSSCGSSMMLEGWFGDESDDDLKPRFSYCPFCGARVTALETEGSDE